MSTSTYIILSNIAAITGSTNPGTNHPVFFFVKCKRTNIVKSTAHRNTVFNIITPLKGIFA